MAYNLQCDICNEEPGTFMVTNTDTGQTNTMGFGCFGLIGLTQFLTGDQTYVDGVLAPKGYAPTAAEKKRRKEEEASNPDPNRTIATITEDQPRPPGSDSTVDQVDSPVSAQVDNDAGDPVTDDPPGESAGGHPAVDGPDAAGDDTGEDAPPF